MSIRWRLTLSFSLILLVILIVTGAVLYILLQRYLVNEIDDSLKVHSAQIHGTINPDQIPASPDYDVIHSKLPPINGFAFPGVYIQIVEKNGNVLVKSDNLGIQELPVDPVLVDKGIGGTASIDSVSVGEDTAVRIMVSPLHLGDQTLLLEVAQSLAPVDIAMSQLRWALLASILVALTLTVISGALTMRRALLPVERITRTAGSIEASSDLSRRVGYRGPKDEIGNLASTFDHMIEHLNKVFASQKHFIADASHELRSPLTVIQGNLDLLKRNLSEEDRRESLGAIESETRRMAKIVNDLLLLAEIESGQIARKEMVPLREILLEEYQRIQPLAGNRKLTLGLQEDLTIKGDTYRLKQLLGNLVDNAIKYTPDGGIVTLSLFRNGDWACLEVTDTGVGISPEHLPHIFDRFYRVDKARSRAKGGTGLGLAIVKGIAEQHEGKVTVISEPGKGSSFTVWLKI